MLFFLFTAGIACAQQTDLLTHCERSGFMETADYEEVIRYSRLLASASPRLSYTVFGVSPQKRDMPLLILDRDGYTDPGPIRDAGRALLLIEAGIHPGEADGTDAALMFARDVAVDGVPDHLLDELSILIIPVFNVDGLARFGPYNRINQAGPREMGWRATAQNLNLNRDFLKADAPEMRAWLKMFNRWMPDFFIDCHTTDGADYQYAATYMMEVYGNMDPGLTRWQTEAFLPYVEPRMEEAGYPIFPYVSFRRWHDPRSGLVSNAAAPRLSHGYSAIRNRPCLLIETHMLKPHQIRVEATRHLLKYTAEIMNRDSKGIQQLIADADAYTASAEFRKEPFPMDFRRSDKDSVMVEFRGVEYRVKKSALTGGNWFIYSDVPTTYNLPWFNNPEVAFEARLPEAYIIPPEWTEVIDRMELHGIEMEVLEEPLEIEVESFLFTGPEWRQAPFEGRHTMTNREYRVIREERVYPRGSVWVDMDQPAARVIAHILEPKAPDSYVYWGFFDAIFEQKEYSETYVMEPLARKMLAEDPELKARFEKKLAEDEDFARSQWYMLNWFYSKTPYWDWKKDKYPVGKIFD